MTYYDDADRAAMIRKPLEPQIGCVEHAIVNCPCEPGWRSSPPVATVLWKQEQEAVMPRSGRKFRVEPGLQEMLGLLIEHKIEKHVERWKQEVTEGLISGELREVLVAIGWVTYRDSRLVHETALPRRRPQSESEVSEEVMVAGGLSPEPETEESLVAEDAASRSATDAPLVEQLQDPEVPEDKESVGPGGPNVVKVGRRHSR